MFGRWPSKFCFVIGVASLKTPMCIHRRKLRECGKGKNKMKRNREKKVGKKRG
jgi:hypothetical protein